MIVFAEFVHNKKKNKTNVILTAAENIIGVYSFDKVKFDFFESYKNKQFMLYLDNRFKLFVDVILFIYNDRVVRLEPFTVTKLELEGFYERWYNVRCKV